jgi:hypothetical protein
MSWKDTIKEEPQETTATASSWKDTIQEEEPQTIASQAADVLDSTAKAGTAGAAGYVTGRALSGAGSLAAKGADFLAGKAGNLNADQINKIASDTAAYGEARPVQDLLTQSERVLGDVVSAESATGQQFIDQVKKQSEALTQRGFTAAEEAVNMLPGPVSKQDFLQTLADFTAGKVDKWGGPIDPNVASDIISKNAVEPVQKYARPLSSNAETVAALEAKKAQLRNDPLGYLSPEYQKIDADLQQALAQKQALMDEYNQVKTRGLNKASDTIVKKSGIPQQITDLRPELAGKALLGTPSRILNKIVSEVDALGVVDPKMALDIMRDSADYQALPSSEQRKIATDYAEMWRGRLGKSVPEFDRLMKESSRAITTSEKLESLGVGKNAKLDTVITTPKGNKLTDIAAYPDKFKGEAEALTAALKESSQITGMESPMELQAKLIEQRRLVDQAESLGYKVSPEGKLQLSKNARSSIARVAADPKVAPNEAARLQELLEKSKSYSPQTGNLTKELELASIKGVVDDSIDAMGRDATSVRRLLTNLPTKGQEAYALLKGSGAGKVLGKVAKGVGEVLPWAGAALGAGMGYANAAEAGLSQPQKIATGVIGAAEEALPFPSPINTTGAAVEGFKEYNRSGELVPAAKAAGKEAIRPMEEFGTQRSNEARARMEQRMNTLKELKKPFKPTAPSHSVEDIQATHDWFKASTDPVAQTYAGPLEKAANSQDERTRAAVMFGLEQQPAFRELQRKQKLGQ